MAVQGIMLLVKKGKYQSSAVSGFKPGDSQLK